MKFADLLFNNFLVSGKLQDILQEMSNGAVEKIEEFRINSASATISLIVRLVGEEKAISIEIRNYRITSDLVLQIGSVDTSRPWLTAILGGFLNSRGNAFQLPKSTAVKVISKLL
jgi:hypothetical protein